MTRRAQVDGRSGRGIRPCGSGGLRKRGGGGRRRAGFVLLEAIVALAILGTVIIAILATVGGQVRSAQHAQALIVARSLAEERLTLLQLLQRDELLELPDSLVAGWFGPPFEGYSWSVTIEPVADAYELYSVEVVVEGADAVFPLRTLMHRPAALTMQEQ